MPATLKGAAGFRKSDRSKPIGMLILRVAFVQHERWFQPREKFAELTGTNHVLALLTLHCQSLTKKYAHLK